MNKKMSVIIGIILTIMCSFFIKNDAYAATTTAPESFILAKKDAVNLTGSNYINGINLTYQKKITNTGKLVFCIERGDVFTSTQETYTRAGIADAGLTYILEHGYPNVSLTGNADEDYWLTGVAVWYYLEQDSTLWRNFDFDNYTYKGSYHKDVEIISNLIKGAKSAYYKDANISINKMRNYLTLNDAGTYYVSAPLTITSTGISTFKAYLTDSTYGGYIGDKSGNVKTTLNAGDTFYVYIPANKVNSYKNIQIKVEAISTVNKAYVYNPAIAEHQSVIALYPESTDVSASTYLSINYVEPIETKVSIYKIDSSSKNNVVGAKLELRDRNGNVIDTWTTNGKAHVIEDLDFGTYYIYEISAPEGYELNTTPVKFTLTEDNYDQSINFYNEPEKIVTTVSIFKIDSATKNGLANATLVVKDDAGNVIDEWVTTTEAHTITGLDATKTYYLSEKSAPEGYELNTNVTEFTVNADGTSKTITISNSPTLPESPQTGIIDTLLPCGLVVTGSGCGLKVLKKKRGFKQF